MAVPCRVDRLMVIGSTSTSMASASTWSSPGTSAVTLPVASTWLVPPAAWVSLGQHPLIGQGDALDRGPIQVDRGGAGRDPVELGAGLADPAGGPLAGEPGQHQWVSGDGSARNAASSTSGSSGSRKVACNQLTARPTSLSAPPSNERFSSTR